MPGVAPAEERRQSRVQQLGALCCVRESVGGTVTCAGGAQDEATGQSESVVLLPSRRGLFGLHDRLRDSGGEYVSRDNCQSALFLQ